METLPRRLTTLVTRPAAAVLAVAVVMAGAGTAAAKDWLPIFQTEKVAPVNLSAADLVALPDLRAYGDVKVTGAGGVREVKDATAAGEQSGLDVPEVSKLPSGVTGEPSYQVGGKVSVTFTYSAAKASAALGKKLPQAPAGLDGQPIRLDAGPGVGQVWKSASGMPALLVGRAVAPTAHSSGIDFATARDYLLSLPGIPADVASKLKAFSADGSTLPLPIPADQVTSSSAKVNGHEATVLTTRDKAIAAVVWVSDGVVTAVAGSLSKAEVLDVARSLR
ncbi:hypothetical protein [Kribbella italica]|uniref:DUF4367 domain-containing protein n=1 Tax=Kribbella italica TaxID=1540520 RepID=A0A7W9MXI3_9ACTN|nr:hypothetical protein [Kribbella italica]MBB5840166.1 hypothetical protein [Kribbella italica]